MLPAVLRWNASVNRERQQALAAAILKDKDVESLSSFIGVDGTNTTPNSGRIQINLKSRDDRDDDVTTIIKRLQQEVAGVEGFQELLWALLNSREFLTNH